MLLASIQLLTDIEYLYMFCLCLFVSKSWGLNEQFQLGLGDTKNRGADASDMGDNLPTIDLGINFVVYKVDCSWGHCCALSFQNDFKCWVK